jgi:hypothetical protein
MLQALMVGSHALNQAYKAMMDDQVLHTMRLLGTDSRDAAILWLVREEEHFNNAMETGN